MVEIAGRTGSATLSAQGQRSQPLPHNRGDGQRGVQSAGEKVSEKVQEPFRERAPKILPVFRIDLPSPAQGAKGSAM